MKKSRIELRDFLFVIYDLRFVIYLSNILNCQGLRVKD